MSNQRLGYLVMFAVLALAGLATAIWLILRGDILLCAAALAATYFAAQQFVATRFAP